MDTRRNTLVGEIAAPVQVYVVLNRLPP